MRLRHDKNILSLLLLTEVSVFKVEWSRIIPISNPELVCLEVHDHILLVAPGVVWHAGAAAAGPPGVAPGGAVHPPPAATALVAANPTILSRETADQVNLVCNELQKLKILKDSCRGFSHIKDS